MVAIHFLQPRTLVASAIAGSAAVAGLHTQAHRVPAPATVVAVPSHTEWVAGALKAMQTIKVGMTRAKLLSVFTTEGGLATPLKQTHVFRDCPYVIKSISRPYVA